VEQDNVTVKQLHKKARESPNEDGETLTLLAEWSEVLSARQNASRVRKALGGLKREELTIGSRIGAGGFGVVYEGRWNGSPVAVKELLNGADLSEDETDDFGMVCLPCRPKAPTCCASLWDVHRKASILHCDGAYEWRQPL
jgi:hypothetical protein